MQWCLVTLRFSPNAEVLSATQVWQVSFSQCLDSLSITLFFIEKWDGWHSPLFLAEPGYSAGHLGRLVELAMIPPELGKRRKNKISLEGAL